jgi:hypothetical protein
MLRRFLDSDCDYLFTLDDDIELEPDALCKLVEADKDIIGGVYRLKTNEIKQNPYALRFLAEDHTIDYDQITEVQYLSTGCMLHKRSFIEELVDAYPDLYFYENLTANEIPALYMPYIYKREYLSEDWAFCQRAIDAGHKIWLHAGVQCTHWGLHPYKVSDLTDKQREITLA